MSSCILLGTSTFALPTAEVLLKLFPPFPTGGGARGGGFIAVITKPTESVGRKHVPTPPPLAVWAKEHGIQCWQPETKEALTALLRKLNSDVAIVVAYGKIIPAEALAIPRFGFVNLHPSLLPKYRGPSPIQTAIVNGDTETGVTLMLLDAEVDHGPILAQERVALSPTATRSSLERELASLGARLLEHTLPDYLAGRIIPQPQNHERATTTPLLSRDHGRINWSEPATTIERKIRAYEGWPGTWTTVSVSPPLSEGERLVPRSSGSEVGEGVRAQNGEGSDVSPVASAKEERRRDKRLKILTATIDGATSLPPGTIDRSHNRLDVACGDHRLIALLTVQLEGKPSMNGEVFLLGHQQIGELK